jgi:Condensation domain
MSKTSQRIDNFSPQEKRLLLARLLEKKASESPTLHPLSYGQQALWFLHQLDPDSAAYNIALTWRIRSGLDIRALQRTFQALVNRHPSLRTTYTIQDGRPAQRIQKSQKVRFEVIDALTWNRDHLNGCLTEEAHRPFNLERGPLLRVSLFTLPARQFVLLVTMHHIVTDVWSLTVLLDELCRLYPLENAEAGAPLTPPEVQYKDYVRWQTEMLAGPEGEKLWAYWQKQLSGELPVMNLPTDRPRPPVQTEHGAVHTFNLSERLTQQLKLLAKAEEATLYTTLLAAFLILLYRYTGQEDLPVGSPMVGRSRAEFEEIVGYFANPVVIRADLSKNPIFTELRRKELASGWIWEQLYWNLSPCNSILLNSISTCK